MGREVKIVSLVIETITQYTQSSGKPNKDNRISEMENNDVDYMTTQDGFITVTLEVYANRQPILYNNLRFIRDIVQADEQHKFMNMFKAISEHQDIFKKMFMLNSNMSDTVPHDTFVMFDRVNRTATAVQIRYCLNLLDAAFNNIRIGDVLMKNDSSGES